MDESEVVHLTLGEGKSLTLGDNRLIHKLKGEDTGGRFALFEFVLSSQSPGPPLHINTREFEGFLVLEGRLVFHAGGRKVEAGAGSFVLIPPGTPHTFEPGTDDVRFLTIVSPAGFEESFQELANIGEKALEDDEKQQEIEKVAARYGIKYPEGFDAHGLL